MRLADSCDKSSFQNSISAVSSAAKDDDVYKTQNWRKICLLGDNPI